MKSIALPCMPQILLPLHAIFGLGMSLLRGAWLQTLPAGTSTQQERQKKGSFVAVQVSPAPLCRFTELISERDAVSRCQLRCVSLSWLISLCIFLALSLLGGFHAWPGL